jgi:hypothetical protein
MPFLKLDNNWSDLAKYYNQSFNNKPEVPTLKYTAFDDGLIRGGVINATLASVRDTARISKFFASGKGVLFITKQVGLQLSNPLLEQEAPKDTFGKLGANTKSNLLNNVAGAINTATSAINSFINKRSPNQIYNLGLNTLAQIPLISAGGHIIRQGTLPIGGGGYLEGNTDGIKGYNYLAIAKKHNKESIQTTSEIESKPNNTNNTSQSNGRYANTVVARNQAEADKIQADLIAKGKIPDVTREQNLNEVVINSGQLSYKNAPNRMLQHLSAVVKSSSSSKTRNSPIILFDYNGGPGSTYGLGKTIIKTYTDNHTDLFTNNKENLLNGFENGKSYSAIDTESNNLSTSVKRQKQSFIAPDDSISSPNGASYNIESRIGVSTLGGRNVDSINVINIVNENIFYDLSVSGSSGTLPSNDPKVYEKKAINTGLNAGGYFGRDIIKFRIEFLNNDTNLKEVLAFRAYIDDFQDGMQAKWSSYRYMGRGEDFYVYDGFSRDMSIAFTMYAHSPEEMKPLYQKLNYLMSAFTPDYNTANKMRGNIGYLTVGDYVYRQPGIFTDIKLSGMLDTHWEIAYDDELPSNSRQYEVPKHIKVALSFKPIHNFLPRRVSAEGKGTTPFVKAPFVTRNSNDNKYLKT